jgi:putative colanic acid biosynthesis glycosyltransferase WcaI
VNILVFSQWFPPEPGGGPARFLEMGRAWAAAGHRVRVVAGIPNWPTGEVHPAYRRRALVRERVAGMDVVRTWVLPARNEGRLKRIANHVSFAASGPLASAVGMPADVVVATSPPLFAAAAGAAVARLRRVPFVFDVRDLWPDAIFALGQLDRPSVRRALRSLEARLYRSASAVVAVSEDFADPIRMRGASRVEVIPNGADLDAYQPGPPDGALRGELGWDGRFVVLYAGTLGMAHGLMRVIEAADAVGRRQDAKDVLFAFVGEGADRPELERETARRGLANVRFHPLQPRERMPSLYRAADACLVSLRPLPLFDGFIPSKLFEIMASGRPVLAAVAGRPLGLVLEAGAGLAAGQEDPDVLVEGIRTLRANPELASEMGTRGRAFVEARYDRADQAARYLALLGSLGG